MALKWRILAAVACGTFMATLDSSIVNIALPTLTKELGADLYRVKWVVIAYLLVITCLLLPCGKLSDQYGKKKVFTLGFLLFMLGSCLCSISRNLPWLVTSRIFQGVGAAMLMANGPAILTTAFPPRERGTALGTMAMVVSIGLISGPSLGGFLISALGWPSIFWINIPIALFGIYLVQKNIKPDASIKLSLDQFDWAGGFVQSLFLMCFIMIFDPPAGASPWLFVVLSVIFLLLFAKIESLVEHPLFDLSLIKNKTFWTANLSSFLMFVTFSSVSVLLPFYLEEIQMLSPRAAGLYMAVIPLTILVIAPISGRLSDRFGSQELSFAGALIAVIGLYRISGVFGEGLLEHTHRVEVLIDLSIVGLSLGLFQSPNNNAIMSSVPNGKLGVASALLATVRNLGLVAGTGLATLLFSWKRTIAGGGFIPALHFAHAVAGTVAIFAMIAALGKKRGKLSSHHHPAQGG